MPRLQINHRTTYRYRKPVAFGEHRLMMRPRESYDQHVIYAQLKISPDASLRHVHDVFGNCISVANFDHKSDVLTFDSEVLLEHRPTPPASDCEEAVHLSRPSLPFAYDATDMPDLVRSMERGFPDPDRDVERWVRRFLKWNGPTRVLPLLTEIARAIHSEFTYSTRLEAGARNPAETLARGSGACRDFAVLMMEAARSLGLAAHFVSGYIYVPPASGDPGVARVGGGHTHAWVAVYLPSCGWVEFDPTNGLVGNRDLVRVAAVRDPKQATPLWGSWQGENGDYLGMEVEVELTREPERGISVA
jgi:transglutaminase-like putative cysteine protease